MLVVLSRNLKLKIKYLLKEYFKTLLDKFTEFMEEQGYNTNSTLNPYGDMYEIFSGGININIHFIGSDIIYIKV